MKAFLRLKWIIISVVVLVVVAIGALAWWVWGSDSPEEVTLEAAVAQVQAEADDGQATTGDETASRGGPADDHAPGEDDGTGESAAEGSGTAESEAGEAARPTDDTDEGASGGETTGIAGIWTVDTSRGGFDYEQATGSFVGFRVDEELTIGEVTAVGRTGAITGEIELTEEALVAAVVSVDMSTIASDRSQRDSLMRSALRTSEYPEATFALTEAVPLPSGATSGEAVSVQAAGDLTIAGVTNPAVFQLQAQLVEDTVVVVGSSPVVFADYDVVAPTAPIVVSVEDHGIIEFQLLLTR